MLAAEKRAEVHQLAIMVGELKEKVEDLFSMAERAKSATDILSLFGHSSSDVIEAAGLSDTAETE
jgi:formylmethanofuran dehydrogenase subunit C